MILGSFCLPRLTLDDRCRRVVRSTSTRATSCLHHTYGRTRRLLDKLSRQKGALRQYLRTMIDARTPFFLLPSKILSPVAHHALTRSLKLGPSAVAQTLGKGCLRYHQKVCPLDTFFSRSINNDSPRRLHAQVIRLLRRRPVLGSHLLQRHLTRRNCRLTRHAISGCHQRLTLPTTDGHPGGWGRFSL